MGADPERAGVTAPHRPNPCERLDNVAAAELLFADGQHPIQRAQHPRRRSAEGCTGDCQGLGAHPTRLQGGYLVRPPFGRLGVPPGAGGRTQHAAQLCQRGAQDHLRLRRRGDWPDRAVACQGAAVRDAGECDQGDPAGSTTRIPTRSSRSRTVWSSCARSRISARAPT